MQLLSNSLQNQQAIPSKYAFGKHHPSDNVALSDNRNPHLHWQGAPAETLSFVLLCVDMDVPTVADNVNQAGKTVPHTLPRGEFYHWVMVDIPAAVSSIAEASCSDGVTPKGKQSPTGPGRQGINDYTGWFAADEDMAGEYFGYDGPCPPWNDERIHHYHFKLFATDLERCPVDGAFTGAQVMAAIAGHVLAEATLVASYHIYPQAQ